MNKFLEGLTKENNYTYTENGALTYKSTLNNCLDFFALGGAMRNRENEGIKDFEILKLFTKAFSENPLVALRILFYLRDIREGMGERKTFRVPLKKLAQDYPDIVRKNIKFIPYFGRWDDLYALFDTPCEQDAIEFMKQQIEEDLKSEQPSLCAKWLKSINTSSKESRRLGLKTARGFGMTLAEYRKMLSKMREKLDVVERKLSENKFDEIEYSKLPSQAMMKYRNLFLRKDRDRYMQYIESVIKNEKKVNTSTLYPYQIVEKILYDSFISDDDLHVLDTLWNNLPKVVDTDENILVVADTSGSMYGRPLAVAVSVALYFAERNKGAFKDYFMTFSEKPRLQKIIGSTIAEKVTYLENAEWGMNTDIEQVFLTLLDVAKKNNLKQEELPSKIIIVSDMEFDEATNVDPDSPLFEAIKKKFEEEGYELPTLVFWNVDARHNQVPLTKEAKNAVLVSGFSINLFKSILNGEHFEPVDFMLEIVNNERYSVINLP